MAIKAIRGFTQLESASGIILVVLAALALIISNSPLNHYYTDLFNLNVTLHLGFTVLSKPIILWINDGLMAIFFLLVGLEIKQEIFEGELNSLSKISLPGLAAIGGMAIPAIIFLGLNAGDPTALRGWAIPTATDIAFSLAILSLFGKNLPISLKIFLTALAIFDDLGAIIIIAIFYTSSISFVSLSLAVGCLVVLFFFNRFGVRGYSLYLIVGFLLWLFVLKSGVHATLAGVALAFAIPLRDRRDINVSPVQRLETALHPWVAFGVLPLFAFANAGVSFKGLELSQLYSPIPLGIILGLFIGKQVGIFGATWFAIKSGISKMPRGADWLSIYGISLICGVGFTMSLFIGSLAFDRTSPESAVLVRFGVIVGSLISGGLGYFMLRLSIRLRQQRE